MALRTFADREGDTWRVWSVTPEPAAAITLEEEFRGGWLCFEPLEGGGRRRLTLTEAPEAWDALSDDRLDLLRRVATPVARPLLDTSAGTSTAEPMEDAARDRRSGPRSVVGGEEGDELR